jgi:hypothetical protein
MSDKSQRIEQIIARRDEVARTEVKTLITNYKAGGTTFNIPQIETQVRDFKEFIDFIKKDALECLPLFKIIELQITLDKIFRKLTELHTRKVEPNESVESITRSYINYFNETEISNPNYSKSRDLAWPLIMDSITLLNEKRLHESPQEKQEEINRILGRAKMDGVKLDNLLSSYQEEVAKRGISKHASIFDDQAIKHRNNATIWGVVSGVFVLLNVILIYQLYVGVSALSGEGQENGRKLIEIGVLSFLLISLLSYLIVQFIRNFFAEKHNQAVNRHKANCLGSFNTFVETASDDIRATILQYAAQTIFSHYNPGYLSKDLMQSPLPIIEMLRTVQTEKKST